MEEAIWGDFALIKAWKADTLGNCIFKGTAESRANQSRIRCTASVLGRKSTQSTITRKYLGAPRVTLVPEVPNPCGQHMRWLPVQAATKCQLTVAPLWLLVDSLTNSRRQNRFDPIDRPPAVSQCAAVSTHS